MHIIGGEYRRRRLTMPTCGSTRPTSSQVREAVFNICQSFIQEAVFLDLFAGSGAMGLEALSRGAQFVTFVEIDKEAIHCIEKNIETLGVQKQTEVLKGDVFAILKRLEKQHKQYSIIYADPPYRMQIPISNSYYSLEVIQWIDQHDILIPEGSFFVEEDFRLELEINNLYHSQFMSARRFGQTILQHYQRKSFVL